MYVYCKKKVLVYVKQDKTGINHVAYQPVKAAGGSNTTISRGVS